MASYSTHPSCPTATKKSNGKSYCIRREFVAPVTWVARYAGKPCVEYQAFHPQNGEPWQAIRTALRSDFIFAEDR